MRIVVNKKTNLVSFVYTKLGLPNVSLMFPFYAMNFKMVF